MSEFNFKSSVCTDRFQSERLLALGLKKETADMYLQSVLNDEWSPFIPIAFPYGDRPEEIIMADVVNAVPAWSLHRLIEMMPSKVEFPLSGMPKNFHFEIHNGLVRYYNGYVCCVMEGGGYYKGIIDCIEWLIKEGYFNKEYLCEK